MKKEKFVLYNENNIKIEEIEGRYLKPLYVKLLEKMQLNKKIKYAVYYSFNDFVGDYIMIDYINR